MRLRTPVSILVLIFVCVKADNKDKEVSLGDQIFLHGYTPKPGKNNNDKRVPSFKLELNEDEYAVWYKQNVKKNNLPTDTYSTYGMYVKDCFFFEERFNKDLKTVMYIGLPTEDLTIRTVRRLLDGFIRRDDYNVFYLDWSRLVLNWHKNTNKYSKSIAWSSVISNIPDIVTLTSKCIDQLVTENLNLKTFHMIGFSIGAHIAGEIASKLSSGEQPARITALDPLKLDPKNYPTLYSNHYALKERAEFVDVIHSSDGPGIYEQLGHVDVYVNKGKGTQPGCIPFRKDKDHYNQSISLEVFIKSLEKNLNATECDNYKKFMQGECKDNKTISIGPSADVSLRGKFYIAIKIKK